VSGWIGFQNERRGKGEKKEKKKVEAIRWK
jgi:hypothetical protein